MAYIPHGNKYSEYCAECRDYVPGCGCRQQLGVRKTLCLALQASVKEERRKRQSVQITIDCQDIKHKEGD